jgi:hypothetical protein
MATAEAWGHFDGLKSIRCILSLIPAHQIGIQIFFYIKFHAFCPWMITLIKTTLKASYFSPSYKRTSCQTYLWDVVSRRRGHLSTLNFKVEWWSKQTWQVKYSNLRPPPLRYPLHVLDRFLRWDRKFWKIWIYEFIRILNQPNYRYSDLKKKSKYLSDI